MSLLIFIFVIAVVVCVVIGKPVYIYLGLSGLMFATCAAMVIIFTIALVLLIFSKRKKARFVRIDLPYRSDRYKCAYYRICSDPARTGFCSDSATEATGSPAGDNSSLENTEEYPCIFPEEGVFRKKLYNPEKECTVFLVKRFRRVFDRYAVITTIIGLVFGLGMGGLLLAMFLF